MHINTYLYFNGQCQEAFEFYADCVGARIDAMMPYRGSPGEQQTPPGLLDKIMHARIKIGDDVVMGSDAPPDRYRQPQGFSLALRTKTPAEAERIFKALSEGGSVFMPLDETFFAHRFGMLLDRFGIPWMVLCEKGA